MDAYEIAEERKAVIEDLNDVIKKIQQDQQHRKEVYEIAYQEHISPRMSSVSPNSSFYSGTKRSLYMAGNKGSSMSNDLLANGNFETKVVNFQNQ